MGAGEEDEVWVGVRKAPASSNGIRVCGLRWILVLILVNGLAPGIAEAMEAVVHLVKTGHVAHSIAGEDDLGDQGPEHSCGATFHHCDCCTGSPGTAAVRDELNAPGAPPSATRQASLLEFGRCALEPLFRPPIR